MKTNTDQRYTRSLLESEDEFVILFLCFCLDKFFSISFTCTLHGHEKGRGEGELERHREKELAESKNRVWS